MCECVSVRFEVWLVVDNECGEVRVRMGMGDGKCQLILCLRDETHLWVQIHLFVFPYIFIFNTLVRAVRTFVAFLQGDLAQFDAHILAGL